MLEIENKRVDEKRLNAMKVSILELETENLRTNDKTNEVMVDAIRKIIANEFNKNY